MATTNAQSKGKDTMGSNSFNAQGYPISWRHQQIHHHSQRPLGRKGDVIGFLRSKPFKSDVLNISASGGCCIIPKPSWHQRVLQVKKWTILWPIFDTLHKSKNTLAFNIFANVYSNKLKYYIYPSLTQDFFCCPSENITYKRLSVAHHRGNKSGTRSSGVIRIHRDPFVT